MDKNFIILIISIAAVATIFAVYLTIYPSIIAEKQNYIISTLNKINDNRVRDFVALEKDIAKSQSTELIKKGIELHNRTYQAILNLTEKVDGIITTSRH